MGMHDGHRMRLRERLKKGSILEHELLEVLLFNGVPRLNTNELAHRLLATFGSISEVFCASMEQLQQVEGIGESLAAYIYVAGLCYERYYEAKIQPKSRPREYETDAFLSFVKETYAETNREVFDLYALDENSRITVCKRFSQDSMFNVEVEPEEIAEFLTKNRASGLVMVHNHPFGDAKASKSDDAVTMKCQMICSFQNVLLCDHVIYSPTGLYSYYRSGRLKKMAETCSIQNMLAKAFDEELK